MKFSLRAFGLGKKKESPKQSPAPAPTPPPIPEVPASATETAPKAGPPTAPEPVQPKSPPPPPPSAPPERGTTAFVNFNSVAVLTLDPFGKIASADGACTKMFGWQANDLLGKKLKLLLTDKSYEELRKFLEEITANPSNQLASLRVTAVRKNGTEFPASITRLAWGSDTSFISKAGAIESSWTAVFRDLSSSNKSPVLAPLVSQESRGGSAATMSSGSQETLTAVQSVNEELRKQCEAATAEADREREALQKAQKEREELVARITVQESHLERARSTIERELHQRKALEQQLERFTATKAELERQNSQELQKASEQFRTQLNGAKAAAERAEAARKQDAARVKQLEEDLARARQERETATRNLTAVSTRHAEELGAEVGQIKDRLEKQTAERQSAEADWQAQLNAAKAAATQAKAALMEEADSRLAAEQQLRDELSSKLTMEQQAVAESKQRSKELERRLREREAELDRVQTERDRHSQKVAALEAQLREQLSTLKAAEQKETASREQADDYKRLEQEVANLRQERQEVQTKYAAEKQAGTKSKRRIKELEKQLRDIASGFTTTKLELEKRVSERGRLEAELQRELDTVKGAVEQAQTAQHEQTVRANLLEQELGQVCQARDDLRAELRTEEQKVLESAQRMEELEARLRESAAELARTKAAAENQAAERTRLESAHGIFADNAQGLIKDLGRLRESEAGQAAEIAELERRVRDGIASLARSSADLEKERGERRRVEQRLATLASQMEQMHLDLKQYLESERALQSRVTDLEQQLRERERALARIYADLQKEIAERESTEQQLQAVGDMSAQLRQYLSMFEESKKIFKRTQEQLEAKLQATQAALSENETKLQKETNERQHFEQMLATAQRSLNQRSEESILELTRLQSELQVEQLERKRLEGDAQQSRYASLDSARVARSMVNNLRRQAQESVESLLQATRRLLEITSEEEQKKLVQSVLESALLLQTSLQESRASKAGSDAADSEPPLRAAA